MDFLAGIFIGGTAVAFGAAAAGYAAYLQVIARLTTEGDGVRILVFGDVRYAMLELDDGAPVLFSPIEGLSFSDVVRRIRYALAGRK